MGSSISSTSLDKMVFKTYGFPKELSDIIGDAEKGFSMIVWGESGQGKSTFVAIICRMLTPFGKVYYNSVEQGHSKSLQSMIRHTNLHECGNNFIVGNKDTYEVMMKKISKNRCGFIVIDSAQALELTLAQWKALREEFPNKAVIVISWADGKNPDGKPAQGMRFWSEIKVRVHRGQAFIDSRYGGDPTFKIKGVYEKFIKAKIDEKKAESGQTELQL